MKPFQLFGGAQTYSYRPKPFRVTIFLMVFCLSLAWLSPAWAGDGDLDTNFNPGLGVTNLPMLWSPTYYADEPGKMLIAGYFTGVNGTNRTALARLKPDGSLDETFNAAIDGQVFQAFLLTPTSADSQILICGEFSIPDGTGSYYYGLARLNHDGSVDTSFAHTFTAVKGLFSAGLQSDGKIVVGGYAMSVNGYPGHTYYLLRLDANGNVDSTYPMREASGALVRGMGVNQADNSARLFGVIPRFSDTSHVDYTVVVDSNGDVVAGTNLGDEHLNGPIMGMVWQADNRVIIVGSFTQVYGTTMNGVARLTAGMGSLDTSFNIGDGANGFVQRVNLYGDQIVLAGDFTSFNHQTCGHLVRLNSDGGVDGYFNSGTGADDRIWTMFMRGDGTWEILGAFQHYNGAPRQCIANLAADGSLNDQYKTISMANSYPATVNAIMNTPQGTLIAGNFTGYNGKLHRNLVRIYSNGFADPSFNCSGVAGGIKSISFVPADNKILVAGSFYMGFGYIPLAGVARINPDGSLDRTFKPSVVKTDGSMPDLSMVARSWDTSGHILVGGDFARVNGVAHSGIVRLNSNGTLDGTFNFDPSSMSGLTNIIVNKASDDEGAGFRVAGKATYNNSDSGYYARLQNDGSLDPSFANGPNPVPHVVVFNKEVRYFTCVSEICEGVIVGGDFTKVFGAYSNPQRNYIARFTPDGLLDTTFNPQGPNGPIYAIQTQFTQQYASNKILIGGAFTSYNGVASNNLARIRANGSLDTSFDPGTGADGAVLALQLVYNNNSALSGALIGGAFTTYEDTSLPGVVQIEVHNGFFNPAIPMLLLK
jgi:uncharacterized delta-60 repeat protein